MPGIAYTPPPLIPPCSSRRHWSFPKNAAQRRARPPYAAIGSHSSRMSQLIRRVPLRFLLLSDIHANWEALQAVAAHSAGQGFDIVLCLGDVVGYGPNPNEVTEWIRTHADVVV